MARVAGLDFIPFRCGRDDASTFLKICSCSINYKLLAVENDSKMMISVVILGRERKIQSLVLMVRPSVAKNRATSEHDFSEKLENFQQGRHDIILNI
jgi:hypothetical protein